MLLSSHLHGGMVPGDMIRELRLLIDDGLSQLFPQEPELGAVQRYAVLAPGKRVRPILAVLTAESFGGRREDALGPALALELVHTASLILDDLPCMDDARERRGRQAAHIAFGEDAALLAAISLLSRAYEIVAVDTHLSAEARCQTIAILARTSGAAGLSAGQYRDLRATRGADAASLAGANDLKTGSLFVAATLIGCAVAGTGEEARQRMTRFGEQLGQAFQIADDIADQAEVYAAPANGHGRATLPLVLGMSEADLRMRGHVDAARALAGTGSPLSRLLDEVFG